MQLRTLACAASLVTVALASPTHAAVTVHTTPFITAPIAANDFEAIGCCSYPLNTVYSQGGVDVEFVGSGGSVITNNFANGVGDFYTPGYTGYDDIKLTSGGTFDAFQFRSAAGFGPADVWYDLLLNGVSIATGNAATLPALTAQAIGFSGATFDEVRLQATQGEGGFNPSAGSALFLDDIQVGNASAAPEPSVWVFMLSGFGLAGLALRQKASAHLGARA